MLSPLRSRHRAASKDFWAAGRQVAQWSPSAASCSRCSGLSPARLEWVLDSHTPSRIGVPSGNLRCALGNLSFAGFVLGEGGDASLERPTAGTSYGLLHRNSQPFRGADPEACQALALPVVQQVPVAPLGGQPAAYVHAVHHRPGLPRTPGRCPAPQAPPARRSGAASRWTSPASSPGRSPPAAPHDAPPAPGSCPSRSSSARSRGTAPPDGPASRP